ncbi:MAG: aldehyde dehydrogenase family protein [Bacteroidota bacterium]|nr:aldehyde dehydrogenase family protein [Bacteroidota bacterium]
MADLNSGLQTMRRFYQDGNTLSYQFRKKQLQTLQKAIVKYEDKINEAMYVDLKKSKEETWTTETGLLMAELKNAIKNLRQWMMPEKVSGSLTTFPSSAKIYRDPLGVILIIAPWNYPLQLLLIPLVGAIAAGNCAVLKPSELAPATEKIIIKIIGETFNENYIKVIAGSGAEVVPFLINSFRFDHIFYTGSTTVGKEIYKLAANDLVPVTLELGGKSPCIVYDDADIKVAARRIILGKFLNAGQTCIAPDYILVHEKIKDKLLEELKNAIIKFYTTDAASSNDFGKIINEGRFKKLLQYLDGSKIFYGGKSNEAALYIEPTIVVETSMDDAIMKEEIFGPILPVMPFNETNEAMQIVSQNANPLAFYLFTKNKKVETAWIKKIPFGGGCINNTVWHFANENFPFGGIGNSGIGAYHGKNTFDLFTHKKPVLKTATLLDPSLKYPPFKGKLKLFKKLIG